MNNLNKIEVIDNSTIKLITDNIDIKKKIIKRFQVERTNAYFNPKVQAGFISPFRDFAIVHNKEVYIPFGLKDFIGDLFETPKIIPEFEESEIASLIEKYFKVFKPYNHQIEAVKGALLNQKHFIKSATGSGKSVIISLIAKILTEKGYKGLILVPNISLTEQFYSDINSYKLDIDTHLIGGENNIKHLEKPLTISTYQSMSKSKELLTKLDFIIVDEGHGIKGSETFDIVQKCVNAKYKIGLSGTLPDNPEDMMFLLSSFGKPKTYITARGLIDLGLATPVEIKIIKLNYKNPKLEGDYTKQLNFIKSYLPRNMFIANLANNIKGNTLILYQHTEHGKELFKLIYQSRGLVIENKHITGKDSLAIQRQNKIYFINGEISGSQRELIRNVFDKDSDAIIVGNYKCVSTGVNIKNLHNVVLASPLKSYITITQSIGRGLRLHDSKSKMRLYDLADNLGVFKKQLKERMKKSYEPEGFDIQISDFNL